MGLGVVHACELILMPKNDLPCLESIKRRSIKRGDRIQSSECVVRVSSICSFSGSSRVDTTGGRGMLPLIFLVRVINANVSAQRASFIAYKRT